MKFVKKMEKFLFMGYNVIPIVRGLWSFSIILLKNICPRNILIMDIRKLILKIYV